MNARTPGKWRPVFDGWSKTHGSDITIEARTPIHNNPRFVGRAYGEGNLYGGGNNSERDANARAMAAAPELIAMLEKILRDCVIHRAEATALLSRVNGEEATQP